MFNRRDFLKLSAAGTMAAAIPGVLQALPGTSPAGPIDVWTTAGALRHSKQQPLKWKSGTAGGAQNSISIDATKEAQEVLGFGAALTDAACYTLNRLDPDVRKNLMHEMFDPAGMGLSVSRICIGSSDYSQNAYSFDDSDVPDPELKFSVDHDKAYILPILREVRAVNPGMWLLGSPWSPPAWMKRPNTMMGGVISQRNFGVYSRYFEKFLDAYAAEGVRVNSVTTQNESDTDQDGNMPACAWPQEYEIGFIRDHLGPMMAKAKNPADIWILDHNYDLWGRVLCTLEKEEVRKFVKGVAWHGYVGTPDGMTKVKKAFPQIDQFWTEGGPFYDNPLYLTEWDKWASDFTDILRNQARCIIAWNYALDEVGKPNIGPFNCAGAVTINSKTRKITRGGQFWAFAHFSTHIRRGAKIVQSSGKVEAEVKHVAARNPDGKMAAVLTNSAKAAKSVTLVAGGSSAVVELAPQSVSTLVWE
jgi:glucosylceramidase